ncbi:MAG: mechanosensitive ion channel family protein [Planctomycetota bacterium]|jgi:small conductance mechanosensitive channel
MPITPARIHVLACVAAAAAIIVLPAAVRAASDDTYTATTASDSTIPRDHLELLLLPLTKSELELEAQAWMAVLRAKVKQISDAEIAVKFKRAEIEQAEEAAEAAREAKEAVEEADRAKAEAATDEAAAEEAEEAARDAEAATEKAKAATEAAREAEEKTEAHEGAREAAESAAEDAAAEAAAEAAASEEETALRPAHLEETAQAPELTDRALEDTQALEHVAEAAEQAAAAKAEIKSAILGDLTTLRDEQTAIVDRVNLVLEKLEEKGGEVEEHRQYIAAVSGIRVDVSDWQAAWATLTGWITSSEGGLRWARNIGKFLVLLLVFWALAVFLGNVADRAMRATRRLSRLMRQFISRWLRRVILAVGFVVALSGLGVDIGPMLAVIGAAGFVLAFALQDSLGNLASGIMILIHRPFDVSDVVDVGGVSGKVESLSLVSTTVKTFDNKLVVVPNNKIWGNVITNVTGSRERRVDMVFGIAYDADTTKAQAILEKIVKEHPLVLEDPEPVIRLHELADSSVNFICRPWAKTEDYWAVYWDVTRSVKDEFGKASIGIPFPQRDIHVHQVPAPEPPLVEVSTTAGEQAITRGG